MNRVIDRRERVSMKMCRRLFHQGAGLRRRTGHAPSVKGHKPGVGGVTTEKPRNHVPHRNHHHHHRRRRHHHHRHLHHPHPLPCLRPTSSGVGGACGAPSNTTQFLMSEKYRLRERSDGSDSDLDLTNMDADPRQLEDDERTLKDSVTNDEPRTRPLPLELRLQDDSLPYFPSEDDLQLSHAFMMQDFLEFCHVMTP